MDFDYTSLQRDFREEIIRFGKKELSPGARERDRTQHFDRALWDKCGEMGLQGLAVPEEYGGIGLDPLSTAIALEAFGYGCEDGGLVFSVCAHLLACTIPIMKYGSDEQKAKYLPALARGEMIAVNTMTEPESGSDAFTMNTTALPDAGGYRVNGVKTFSSNGPVADLAVLYAVTDPEKGAHGGISVFLVEKGTPGFSPGQKYEKMGLRTCPIGEMIFDEALLPAESMLGEPGSGTAIFNDSMAWERVCIAASHLGTINRLLDQAVTYARVRKSSGKKIGAYQAVSHKIADMKIALESARLLVYKAASRLDRARDVALDASMVKVLVSETLIKAAMDTLQIHGGYGFMAEYDVERTLRDSMGGTLYSGTNEVHRNIVARWLGVG